jgi:hypothetical protein
MHIFYELPDPSSAFRLYFLLKYFLYLTGLYELLKIQETKPLFIFLTNNVHILPFNFAYDIYNIK